MNHPLEVFVLTRLVVTPEGHVKAENVGATFDIFVADAHRAIGVEHDFERYPISASWPEEAEKSGVVSMMRAFRQMMEQIQAEALR